MTTSGEVRITFPDGEGGVDLDGMLETCALDAADRGPLSAAEVAPLLGLNVGRVNVIAERAMRKMAAPLAGHADVAVAS